MRACYLRPPSPGRPYPQPADLDPGMCSHVIIEGVRLVNDDLEEKESASGFVKCVRLVLM